MASKVLILGGTSYVAQFLCERFLRGDVDAPADLACTVRSVDVADLPAGFRLATGSPTTHRVVKVFDCVDLRALDSVTAAIDSYKPHVIINCVAMASPAACERDPTTAGTLNNPTALISFLQSRPGPLTRYFHFSTDFVYHGVGVPPRGYAEEDARAHDGQCMYGASKLAFDNFLVSQSSPNLHCTVLRIANVIGGQAPLFPDQPPKFAEWLYHQLFLSGDTFVDPVRLWRDEVRSFLYVQDLVSVIWRLVALPPAPKTQIFNVGGVDALSRVEFAERLILEHKRLYPTTEPARNIDNCERATVDLGYSAPLDARMDYSRLLETLETFHFTPTDQFLRRLCEEFHRESAV